MSKGAHSNGFKIGVTMVECFKSAVLDEGSSVSDDSTGGTADVLIDLKNLFDGFGNNKCRIEPPLDSQHHTLITFDANG